MKSKIKTLPDGYHITAHLTISEIKCRCGCGFGTQVGDFDRSVAEMFEKIRDEVSFILRKDTPLRIHSGCRCEKHNKEIGGAVHSYHIDGMALDIEPPMELDYRVFYGICCRVVGDAGGVGYYSNHRLVHIDCRGHRARWGIPEESDAV